jgi:hypothetical protein
MNVRKILGPERVKAITSVLKKNNTTTSAKVREAKIKKVTKALKRWGNVLIGQRKTGIDVPAGMGKKTADNWLREELKARGIVFSNKR